MRKPKITKEVADQHNGSAAENTVEYPAEYLRQAKLVADSVAEVQRKRRAGEKVPLIEIP